MIKCIATDMDGTLLNSIQKISPENLAAILKAQAQGIEVVVATGRSYEDARYVLDEVNIQCPVISVNGAEVRSKEGKVISATPMDQQLAKKAAAILSELDIYYEVYTNKGIFTIDRHQAVQLLVDIIVSANPGVDIEQATYAAGARLREDLVTPVEDYEHLFTNEEFQIYKLFVYSLDTIKLDQASRVMEDFEELTVTASGYENIEITHKDAQKGIALEAFVKAKGLELSETMAIGDNYNDISMLEKAGRAVAMGNAGYEIKALCDVITDTNNENGVAAAILEVL